MTENVRLQGTPEFQNKEHSKRVLIYLSYYVILVFHYTNKINLAKELCIDTAYIKPYKATSPAYSVPKRRDNIFANILDRIQKTHSSCKFEEH